MPATAPIDTPTRPGNTFAYPVAAATIIYAGTLVAVNAAGNAVPAANTAGLKVVGIAQDTYDNAAGLAGAMLAVVERGTFLLPNSATSALTVADIGTQALVEADDAVAKVASQNIKAGRILSVHTSGVWVAVGDIV
jgi:hypothetical protein